MDASLSDAFSLILEDGTSQHLIPRYLMAPDENAAQEKRRDEHVEFAEHRDDADADMTPKDVAVEAVVRGQAATGYEKLTLLETIMTFKVSTVVCFAAAFSAATDGYQVG